MMLAVSAFSPILPAFRGASGGAISALALVALALAGGVMFIHFLGQFIYSLQSQEVHESKNQTRAWLFVTAMMLHNFPESLPSGASLNVENIRAGLAILVSISLQNLPEGLMTAVAFQALGMSPRKAFFGAVMTGMTELFGGVVGGAMLFVSTKELWAQSQGHPERVVWKLSFAIDFLLMASMSFFSF